MTTSMISEIADQEKLILASPKLLWERRVRDRVPRMVTREYGEYDGCRGCDGVEMGKAKDRTRRQIFDGLCGNNEAYQDLGIVLVHCLGIRGNDLY